MRAAASLHKSVKKSVVDTDALRLAKTIGDRHRAEVTAHEAAASNRHITVHSAAEDTVIDVQLDAALYTTRNTAEFTRRAAVDVYGCIACAVPDRGVSGHITGDAGGTGITAGADRDRTCYVEVFDSRAVDLLERSDTVAYSAVVIGQRISAAVKVPPERAGRISDRF